MEPHGTDLNIDDLKAAIRRCARKLADHRELYAKNEAAVRDHLVSPILRALVWDVEDPKAVVPDETGEEGAPDYTLQLGTNRAALVEVKNAAVNLDDFSVLGQLGKYLIQRGIAVGILTNGEAWRLYRSFKEHIPFRDRLVWEAFVSEETVEDAATKLLTVHRARVEHLEDLLQHAETLKKEWEKLLEQPDELTEVVSQFLLDKAPENLEAELYPGYVRDFVASRLRLLLSGEDDETAEAGPPSTGTPPEVGRGHGYQVLINACEEAIRAGKLRLNSPPLPSGHKRYIFNQKPIHQDGSSFKNPKKLSNGLWVEAHASRSRQLELAQAVRKHFQLA